MQFKCLVLLALLPLMYAHMAAPTTGWSKVKLTTALADPVVQSVITFSKNWVASKANDKNSIPTANVLTSTTVNTVQWQAYTGNDIAKGKGFYYQITFVMYGEGNDSSTYTLNATTAVIYDAGTKNIYKADYDYNVTSVTPVPAVYGPIIDLPLAGYNNSVVQSLLAFGGDYVINEAINNGSLTANSTSTLAGTGFIQYQEYGSNIFYYFNNVPISNSDPNIAVNATYAVFYVVSNNTRRVTSYRFNIRKISKEQIIIPPNKTCPTPVVPVQPHNLVDDCSTANTEKIGSDELTNGTDAYSLATFGADYVVSILKYNKQVSSLSYQVGNIISATRTTTATYTYYRFNLQIIDVQGKTFELIVTVRLDVKTGDRVVVFYQSEPAKPTNLRLTAVRQQTLNV